jgi:Ni2+-binding GTPase involved in maturation of urease and hydrogenase
MIGGFLGAGKTTVILKLAEHLATLGQTVGLITNDQSVGLVDTTMLASHGFAVEEITGGCFCCRFNSLVEAADKLSSEARPDVFIAEPVGSCTDLKASVSYPLRRIYGEDFSIAPLSVLIDPIRALRIFGLEEGKAFSKKVVYVYNKQLEEAEQIVINKIDLLSADRLSKLREALSSRYPKAKLFEISARQGTGLAAWFDSLASDRLGTEPAMEMDYELYAEGEALLGWLNCTVELSIVNRSIDIPLSPSPGSPGEGWGGGLDAPRTLAGTPSLTLPRSTGGGDNRDHCIDGNELLRDLANQINRRLQQANAEIAHLKMTLTPGGAASDLAVLNLTRNDQIPEMSHTLVAPIDSGELIVNLRAEANPQILKEIVTASLQSLERDGLRLRIEHLEHFRPGKPQPTHRYAQA